MHAGRFCDAGPFLCFVEELLYRIGGYMVILLLPLKQPLRWGDIFSSIVSNAQGPFGTRWSSGPASFALFILTVIRLLSISVILRRAVSLTLNPDE